jgi:RNA polymerase sigma-70 factor (ECF subfamily)
MTAASRNVPVSGRSPVDVSPAPATVVDLLRRSGRGDETAFAQLYDSTSSRLFGLVLGVVRDVALAEEVAQEAYLRVWRHSARFDPNRGSAVGWIMTTAHRAAVDRLRDGTSPMTTTVSAGPPAPLAAPAM